MKKLKTLTESNAQNISRPLDDTPVLNGIECPRCKQELYDSNPMITLTSYPAQKNIHCNNCGYKGYRFI